MKSILTSAPATKIAGCIAALLLLCACSQAVLHAVAQEPTNDTVCVLDGMVLKEHPGPKAQIQYIEGKPDFFCDLMELFTVLLVPEQRRRVAGVFVQDMGKAEWSNPNGHWIDAKTAIYVVDSKKPGSMGPTFGSFSDQQDATAFVKKEGGRIVPFDQITSAMASSKGVAAHGNGMEH